MEKFYTIHQLAKLLGVTTQTLRNWDRSGKLKPHHTSSNGYRYYLQEDVNTLLNIKPKKDRLVIGYCRVSSKKQKDDLDRQIENVKTYLLSQGKPFKIITDIGSGINYDKSGLQELVRLILDNAVVNLSGVKLLSTVILSPVPVLVVVFTAKILEAP